MSKVGIPSKFLAAVIGVECKCEEAERVTNVHIIKKKILLHLTFLFICFFVLLSCHSNQTSDKQSNESESPTALVDKSNEQLEEISLAVRRFNMSHSAEDFNKLNQLYGNLKFNYDKNAVPQEHKSLFAEQEFKVDSVKMSLGKLLDENVHLVHKSILKENDHLLAAAETKAFYLRKGDKLFVDFQTSGNVVVKIYNADSHATLKTYINKKAVKDSIKIAHSAIYLLEMKPTGNTYVDVELTKSMASLESYNERDVEITESHDACAAKDFGAKMVRGIKITNIFEEPHKITLRSALKSAFSGGKRSVVAMNVPAGSTDVAYSLRISTSQSDQNGDGQFCRKVDEKYKQIKFLGLPLYESKGSNTNIFRELLNYSEPYREEEAYCNLYVFTSSTEAKKFSDGTPVSQLKYNVDYSKQGTQSCNDRIPTKGVRTIYFGLENTRMRYSVYLWLESLATVPTTEYYKTTYTVTQ